MIEGLLRNEALRKRLLFTLWILVIYRIGVHVPTPGADNNAVGEFIVQSAGIFGLLNTFTGGALESFSVFALGIMPYISSSIIFQLFRAVKKRRSAGSKKNQSIHTLWHSLSGYHSGLWYEHFHKESDHTSWYTSC